MGYPHPDHLLATLSSRQIAEWMVFFSIEGPIGEERADLRAGIIASTLANVNRGKGKPFRPTDFMPYTEKDEDTDGETDDISEQVKNVFTQFRRAD